MDKFLNSHSFRFLVCFILVCCILVNISPFNANASAVVGSVITGTGLFATLFAMSLGVVFVDLTADLINALGNSFTEHVTKSSATDNETEILNVWIEPIQVDLNSGGISQLPPDQDDDPSIWGALAGLFTIPYDLKDNFLNWARALINGDAVIEVPESEAPKGFMYYNGMLLSTFDVPAEYPSVLILNTGTGYTAYCSAAPFVLYEDLRGLYVYLTDKYVFYRYNYDTQTWGEQRAIANKEKLYSSFLLAWTNFNLYRDSGELFLASSEPSPVKTEPILPNIYVGDIPQKVQSGDFNDDDYNIPYINPIKLWENQTDAVHALNNVATQLQDQTMTYDQYLQQIQTSTGTSPDSGSNSGSSSDVWEPPENPGEFSLDLSKYFPFCIPFDLYDFFSCLRAAPEAPVINWDVPLPGGGSYPLVMDLSKFDDVAQLLRRLQLLLFCVGLAFKTRDLIKG